MNPPTPELHKPDPATPSGDRADVAAPSPMPQPESGRRKIVGAVAVGAALAGMGWAWWRGAGSSSVPAEPPPEGFWATQWSTPAGAMLDMRSLQGKPLLVNFWATWCPPCVDELPLINGFFLKNRANDWQVLGLAVDKLQAVQSFLQKTPLDFPVGMAGLAGTELSRSFGNLAGGLPFTVVLGRDGTVLHRKMGRVHPDDLRLWAGLK